MNIKYNNKREKNKKSPNDIFRLFIFKTDNLDKKTNTARRIRGTPRK